ncbi:hypothetical protein ACCD01_31390, partial [Telluria sp. Tellsp99]
MKKADIKPRHAILALALVGAALLAAFGDRAPQGDIAEPVERPVAKAALVRTAVPAPVPGVAAAQARAAPPGQPQHARGAPAPRIG